MQLKKISALIILVTSLSLGAYGLRMSYDQKYATDNSIIDDSGNPISAIAGMETDKTNETNKNKGTKEKPLNIFTRFGIGRTPSQTSDNYKNSGNTYESYQSSKSIKASNNLKDCYERANRVTKKTRGWIYIQGTSVNYPIMGGESNNYWLTRSWTGKPSVAGSIFLDENQYDFGHGNLIHGHNMCSGRMFATLKRFKDEDFFNSNHPVYLYDGSKTKVYKVFSVFIVPQNFTFQVNIADRGTLGEYAKNLYNKSMYKTIKPNQNDLLILNTCVSDGTHRHQITVAQEIN